MSGQEFTNMKKCHYECEKVLRYFGKFCLGINTEWYLYLFISVIFLSHLIYNFGMHLQGSKLVVARGHQIFSTTTRTLGSSGPTGHTNFPAQNCLKELIMIYLSRILFEIAVY